MRALQEIKDELAVENGHHNWNELLHYCCGSAGFSFPEIIDQVAKVYAEQALDLAAEKAEGYVVGTPDSKVLIAKINKDSILRLKSELK